MTSQLIKELKQKYGVYVYTEVYCNSMTQYYAKAKVRGGGKIDIRDIDMSGVRIMWKNKPFTYKGYPQYVRQSVINQLKQMSDEGELSVYEYDRDGNRRYHDLRYHNPEYLKRLIEKYFDEMCMNR